ncbi:hypothetical protein [Haliangium sp.]|uniref:hypothetical protein n=1 Tax=Haliangium sp. TaxID=2663208 RepID=UPI003D131F06
MIAYIDGLGRALDRAWLARGRDERVFSELAYEHLAARPPASELAVSEIVDWLFSPAVPVSQPRDRSFGQPPVKLYHGHGFFIEALFWTTGTTAIHQHAFSGVFTPLMGSSVHTAWRFAPEQRLSTYLQVGALERITTEHLQVGDLRRIEPGDGFVHQLFHLELPSVTMVVRTQVEPEHQPQYSYLPPGVAVDPFRDDPIIERRVMMLAVLHRAEDPAVGSLEEHAERMICGGDGYEAHRALSYLVSAEVGDALLARLLRAGRATHGELVDRLYEAATHQRRITLVSRLRAEVKQPDLRFLLALLMLLPERDPILALVAARCPDADPVDTIMGWLEGLSGLDRVGVEFDELNLSLFRALVAGCDRDGLLAHLGEEYDPDDLREQEDELLAHAAELACSDIFVPLFSDSRFAVEAQAARRVVVPSESASDDATATRSDEAATD